jgi:hypothetical protein
MEEEATSPGEAAPTEPRSGRSSPKPVHVLGRCWWPAARTGLLLLELCAAARDGVALAMVARATVLIGDAIFGTGEGA